MTSRIFTGVLTVMVILGIGCESNLTDQSKKIPNQNKETPVALSMEAAKEAYLTSKEKKTGPITYDKILAEIALEVPGYGGHFEDEEGILNVYLIDDQERENIKTILRHRNETGVLSVNDENVFSKMRIQNADYNFLQLYNWKVALNREIMGMKGATMLDINEIKNNLSIGIEDLKYEKEILDKIRQIGIPETAINIIEQSPAEYELRNNRNKLAGGLQIEIGDSGNKCTLGPATRRNGIKGFLVNSHCSDNQFSVDGTYYWQAKRDLWTNPPTVIALETVDPTSFTGGDCPGGRQCAYADAAFAQWVGYRTWSFGRIYETQPGTTNALGPNYVIVQSINWPGVGNTVTKVGRTTGTTFGSVTQSCVSTNVFGTNITMLCQYVAGYESDGGDSGSPVFKTTPFVPPNVELVGIHWGTGSGSVFSVRPLIDDHLGGTIEYH